MDAVESTVRKRGRFIHIWEEFGIFHVTDAYGRDSAGGSVPAALTRALTNFPEHEYVAIEDLNAVARIFEALTVEV
jgi:hypothetical protein